MTRDDGASLDYEWRAPARHVPWWRRPGLVALAVLAVYSLFWALVGAGLAWWWVGF